MAEYRLIIKPSAAKEFDRLTLSVASRIETKIAALAIEPRPPGVKRLKDREVLWRVRIGDWRVIYSIDDENRVVEIIYIRHRSKAYD